MGGLFSSPKPVAVATTPDTTTSAETSATEAAATARAEARERARLGVAGTINTSARGVLDAIPALAGNRKTLLGE
ncbi:hypothetical protein IAI18_22630 [Acetobacteraceae bacterium H6797]|nr:hypothetical protein [Acetobacteraceae bacterium H6797]